MPPAMPKGTARPVRQRKARTMSHPAVVSRHNWQAAVRVAVELLPDDIQASLAWEKLTARGMVIRVAVESWTGDPEGQVNRVDLVWWDTVRDHERDHEVASPGGADVELYRADDPRWDWPVVSISSAVVGASRGVFAGRATVALLIEHVQAAVLEEMWSNGSATVFKDECGLFRRKDGDLILAWQSQDLHL